MTATIASELEVKGNGPPDVGDGLRLQILGPLRLWRHDVELEPGSRRQAYLLAVLLARVGRPTSKDELIDLIWGDDVPETARNIVHKYVGTLRHLLEPTLPARATGSFLLRRGDSYLLAADAKTLDVVAFRQSVCAAADAFSRDCFAASLDRYTDALALWSGPAGNGLSPGPGSLGIFARLNGEFFDACTAAAALAVSVGRPERVVPALYLATTIDPWHEPVHAGLITTLGAAGRQAEALSVYREIRERLIEDLGISPGRALEDAYRAVLDPISI
jgi:DNA-binding SARP family transcriptional activator